VNLPFLVRVEGKTATLTPDGAVPVTLSCIGPAACEGALIVGLSGGTNTELGRSDIAVPQGATRTLGVPVTPAGSSALAGRTSAGIFVTADVFPTLQKLPRAQQNGYDALGFGMLTLTVPPDARR
jgi:hypothetical protein